LEALGKILSFKAPRGLGTDLDWISAAMLTTRSEVIRRAIREALNYVNDPRAADALADDIVRDAAELIATTRALADTVKGRKVH